MQLKGANWKPGDHGFGSKLGPASAEHPLKPHIKTQNRAKRCNRLDNRNRFGTREVALFPQWFLWFAGILGSNWVQVSRGFFVHYSTLLVRRLRTREVIRQQLSSSVSFGFGLKLYNPIE